MAELINENSDIEILMVDDDEIDVENVKRCFKKNNIRNPLHVACDGQEALELLEGKHSYRKLDKLPGIILLDINMPRMNGLEFLDIIRSSDKYTTISVFMLTTSDTDKDVFQAYQKNVAGYIVKPVQLNSLFEIVKNLGMYWSILRFPNLEKVL